MSVKLVINEPSIGLTDRTTYLNYGKGNSFRLQQGARATATFYFRVSAGDSYAPTIGTPIYFYEVTLGIPTCAFCGTIDQIGPYEWIGNAGDHYVRLTCVSFEQTLDTLIIYGKSYASTTADKIVLDLLQTVCAGVPVSAGIISAGASIPSIVFDGVRVSDAIQSLATQSGFIWGVDPVTQSLFFRLNNASPAPLTITQNQVLWETAKITQGRQNYRNRQSVRVSFAAFNPSNVFFAGNGATTVFSFPYLAELPLSIIDTTGVQAARVGTFTGQPSGSAKAYLLQTSLPGLPATAYLSFGPTSGTSVTVPAGTTATVGTQTYTFVSVINNAVPNQILARTATCGSFALDLASAINGDTSNPHISSSTLLNPDANATNVSARTEAFAAVPGVVGNSLSVSCSTWFPLQSWEDNGGSAITKLGGGINGTVTVGSQTYTYVATVANATPNQLKCASGTTLAQVAAYLANALNGVTDGVTVSTATVPNPSASGATTVNVGETEAIALAAGVAGNSISVSVTNNSGSWRTVAAGGGIVTATLAGGVVETITVNTYVYTFVSALDNTLRNMVLIGANLAATVQNFADAINANPSTAGVGYSLPTWENDVCNADTVTGTTLTVRTKLKGTNQNAFPLTKSSAEFSWAGATTTGGTDGVDVSKTVSLSGTGAVTDETFAQAVTTGHAAANASAFIRRTTSGPGKTSDTLTVGAKTYTFVGVPGLSQQAIVYLLGGGPTVAFPVAGNTLTIGSVTYSIVSAGAFNNAVPNQIKETVGSAIAHAVTVAMNQLSGDPLWGTSVSSSTTYNPDWLGSYDTVLSGAFVGGWVLEVASRMAGAAWNGVTFSSSGVASGFYGVGFQCSAPATVTDCGGPNAATFGGADPGAGWNTPNQILGSNDSFGLTAARFAQIVADAISATPSEVGLTFSNGTTANADAVGAVTANSGEVKATSILAAASANSIAVGASLTGGTGWTDTSGGAATLHLVGGLDNTIATVSQLTATTAPAAGHSLSVSYRRVGTDIISVENTSLVTARSSAEHGTGKYQVLKLDTSNTSAVAGLLSAQQNLAAFALLVSSFQFSTDSPGVSPGQYLTVTLASPAPASMQALINGNWIVQQVDANLLAGMDAAPSPGGHFRYTVSVVSSAILNYLQFWTNLSGGA